MPRVHGQQFSFSILLVFVLLPDFACVLFSLMFSDIYGFRRTLFPLTFVSSIPSSALPHPSHNAFTASPTLSLLFCFSFLFSCPSFLPSSHPLRLLFFHYPILPSLIFPCHIFLPHLCSYLFSPTIPPTV